MQVRTGYKQSGVGEIPNDWEAKRFGDGVELISGHHVLAHYCNSVGQGTPYLTGPADFAEGSIKITKFTVRPAKLCRSGDILVTVKGSGAGSTVIADGDYCISRQLMAIRSSTWDVDFLHETIRRNAATLSAAATGLIPGLSREDLLGAQLAIPPLVEQRAISAALGHVDALLAGLDHLIAKKRDLKQAAMQQLLTGQTRLPGFREGWTSTKLGELLSFKNGLNKAKVFFGHGTPIVNYMDVFRDTKLTAAKIAGRVSLTSAELRTFDVRKGDVFFTRTSETTSEIGMAAVMLDDPEDTVFSGFLLRGRPIDNRLRDEFKAYCFQTAAVRRQIVAKASYTTRALTNGRLLSSVVLDLPGGPEQSAIAGVLSDMDAELTALEARRDKTRALKQGMMQELLTGRTRLV